MSSKHWRKQQSDDPYVKEARRLGYRSRASFKLIEIQDRNPFLAPGMRVLDLGGAPGGWSQVAIRIVGRSGFVLAVDLLEIPSIMGVHCVQGDAFCDAIQDVIAEQGPFDAVISDIAPNTTGVKEVDQLRSEGLAEAALAMAARLLNPGGHFLVKLFQGGGFDQYLKRMREQFASVLVRKPKSSRADSKEIFLLGFGLRK